MVNNKIEPAIVIELPTQILLDYFITGIFPFVRII